MSGAVFLKCSSVSLPVSVNRIDQDWTSGGPGSSQSLRAVFAAFCSFRIRCSLSLPTDFEAMIVTIDLP